MPPKIFAPFLRSRQSIHQVPNAWRSPYRNVRHNSTEQQPSRLSQSLATVFWRACIALSLIPPAYFVYLLKERFFPSRSASSSSMYPLPPWTYPEDRLLSPALGQRAINVRLLRGDDGRRSPAIEIRLAEAKSVEPSKRYITAKAALEVLDDAGLLGELEERWKEREVERAAARERMVQEKKQERDGENNKG